MTHHHAAHPYLSPVADQEVLSFLGSPQRLLVGTKASNGEYTLVEGGGERGYTAPRHVHRDASETFIVLSGELLIDIDGERVTACAGDAALLPRNIPHTFVVVSEQARYLTLHTPAGFDTFVRHVGEASRDGSPPDRSQLVAIAAEHGIDILGPGLTPDDPAQDRT